MQVVVDSLLTHYEMKGSGKLVVLLHGWGDSAAGLKVLHEALAKEYRVVAIDLPGFGGTQAPPKPWGLNEYAHFIEHFLLKIRGGKTWAIIGHSNGGAIAIRGVGQGWLETERVVLIASAGIRGTYKGRMKTLRMVTKAGKALTMPLPKSVKNRLRKTVYTTVGSDMLVAEGLQETFKRVVTDDVRTDAARIFVPTLLLYGEKDTATPVWYGERYHELIKDSTLEIFPGVGHFVHSERPAEVAKAIEGFLR
jgi:pimeloyl-ACP methyl ester carboxylesterase